VNEPAVSGIEFVNGRWLNAAGFDSGRRYVVGTRISMSRPARIDTTIDLEGAYIVPPFGEAHNHNVDFTNPTRTDSVIRRYLRDGVFYAFNPAILPRTRAQLAGKVNVPNGVDAIFSNGALIVSGGHPMGLYQRNLQRGAMTAADGEGGFFWVIDSLPDLERKWPSILALKPDFIKVMLLYSEEYEKRRNDTAYFNWKGLNPALVPRIVARAHAAHLRVAAHIETARDFHNAVAGGVDIVAHMPGFRGNERGEMPNPVTYAIDPADARLAAQRRTIVVTTLGGIVGAGVPDEMRRRFNSLETRNLRLLRDAGVRLALGSDNYRDDSSAEAQYLATLRVFDNRELLRLWSVYTPRAIFPDRRVGCLEQDCEASFLVLGADPTADFAAVHDIKLRVKDGKLLLIE
jgi:hypothetical protein